MEQLGFPNTNYSDNAILENFRGRRRGGRRRGYFRRRGGWGRRWGSYYGGYPYYNPWYVSPTPTVVINSQEPESEPASEVQQDMTPWYILVAVLIFAVMRK